MILNNIHFEPYENYTRNVNVKFKEDQFPILRVDRDSYIVSAQIQSGINFDESRICHNLLIGKYCSLADNLKFMIGLNHDYSSITTGVCSFLKNTNPMPMKIKRKNQILLQNDVWVGSGATVMSGVTIHNGAVIACNAHVVKDVPPYAIVGGNPAKIIKYRFSETQIEKLLKIAWWDWSEKKLEKNKHYFSKSIDEFIERFYEEANREPAVFNYEKTKPICLFFPDLDSEFPITEHVIRSFCNSGNDFELMLFLGSESGAAEYTRRISEILKKLGCENNDNIVLQIDPVAEEKSLFRLADYYITSRDMETIRRTCFADEFGVKTLSGVDDPIF